VENAELKTKHIGVFFGVNVFAVGLETLEGQ